MKHIVGIVPYWISIWENSRGTWRACIRVVGAGGLALKEFEAQTRPECVAFADGFFNAACQSYKVDRNDSDMTVFRTAAMLQRAY